MARHVEVLISKDLIERGRMMLQAMVRAGPAAGLHCIVRPVFTGTVRTVLTYGLGHPERRPKWMGHVAKGGRVIAFDLGYWGRKDADFSMRMTVDGDHPQRWIAPEDPQRFAESGIRLRDDFGPHGPVVLCGMGWKAKRVFAGGSMDWEEATLARIRAAYPGRRVIFKPKRDVDPVPRGVPVFRGTIEEALRGASLLVCRHSNTAIDAYIAGVPVVCEDGAAAALYGTDIERPVQPTPEARLAFLESLAHWQYRPSEAGVAWAFLRRRGFV
jgi:hypothetical protein